GMNNESTWWSGTTFDMTSPGWRPARFSPMPRCITAALLMSREISSTGQAEDALCDDVRLHLGGAAGDRADARPQERLLPASAVASGGELRFRPEQLERELVQALRQVRPEELHQGRLRTGLLAALEPGQGAAVHQAHDLDVDPAARHLLADPRVAGAASRACQGHDLLQRDPLQHLLLEGEAGPALVRQCGERDLPAPVDLADDVRPGNADGVEEDLAELRRAGELAEGADADPGALHVQDEVGEAAVLREGGVGAGEEGAAARDLRVARPDLLPGDDEVVAVELGARPHGREIAARVGLAEELTPDLLARENGGQETALEPLVAVGDERRSRVVDPDPVQELG